MRLRATVYRALNPRWAREPLSGEGARLQGGRFNPGGMPALCTSLDVMTAVREANQAGSLQPTALVSYEADVEPVLDGLSAAALAPFGATPAALADPAWRQRLLEGTEAPTQALARRLVSEGWAGLRVPSYAPGAQGANLVLWRWGPARPVRLVLVDDEGRLG